MERPTPIPPRHHPASNLATMLAAMMLLVCAGSLFLLIMSVNPFISGVLVIAFVFGPLAMIQYLIWGRWLERLQAEEQAREREQNQADSP